MEGRIPIEKYISYSEEIYPGKYKTFFSGDKWDRVKVTIKCYVFANAITGHIYIMPPLSRDMGYDDMWYYPTVSVDKLAINN